MSYSSTNFVIKKPLPLFLFAIFMLLPFKQFSQKVTVRADFKQSLESVVEFNSKGVLMELIKPVADKYNNIEDYNYSISQLDTGFQTINSFDGKTFGFQKMRFMNRFIMKDKIVVVCMKVTKKPVKFQLYGFSIDKNTLKADPNPVLLLERDGTLNLKTGYSFFQRDNNYGIAFGYNVQAERYYSMAEIAIFNQELQLIHSFPSSLFLKEDLGSTALPEKDYRLIRERSANGNLFMTMPKERYSVQPMLRDEFVFLDAENNLVIWMPVWSNSGKNDRDIFSHIIFKTLKSDKTVLTKCIDISAFELYDVALLYNPARKEIFLTGPYKGDAFGKYTAFTSALYSYPDLKEQKKSTHPFSAEIGKAIHTFYDKPDMGEQGILYDADLMIPVAGQDGSYYTFYRYFYSGNKVDQQRNFSNAGDMNKSFTDLRSYDYRPFFFKRNDYGPIILTALTPSLELKWTNIIPKWNQADGDHAFSGFHPIASGKGLAVIYNELSENLSRSLTITEPKKSPDRLNKGVPVVVLIDESGKMTRKPLLAETEDSSRLFDIANAVNTGPEKAVFILKPSRPTFNYKFNFVEVDCSK